MTHGVVDVFEMVKIHREHSDTTLVFEYAQTHGLVEFFKEVGAVWQIGQRIVISKLVNAVFGLRAQTLEVGCVLTDQVIGDADGQTYFVPAFVIGLGKFRLFRMTCGRQQVIAQHDDWLQQPLAQNHHQNAGNENRKQNERDECLFNVVNDSRFDVAGIQTCRHIVRASNIIRLIEDFIVSAIATAIAAQRF